MWGVEVTSGRTSEAEGAKRLLTRVKDGLTRWEVVWGDGGYEHRLEDWVTEHCSFRVEVIKRPDGSQGYVALPKRWVVERTFAWLGRWRRLAKEYERLPESTEAVIYLASIRRLLTTLARVS